MQSLSGTAKLLGPAFYHDLVLGRPRADLRVR